MYSFATISIPRPAWSPLIKPNGGGGRRTTPTTKNVVCSCPHFGSGSGSGSRSSSSSGSGSDSGSKKELPLPPGPSPLNLMGLVYSHIRSLPYHHALTDLAKKYGPLLYVKVGQAPVVLVSSAEIARELLKGNDAACATRPKTRFGRVITYDFIDIVTSPYGDYWKQLRHLSVTELLSAKNVRSFDCARREEASMLIEAIGSLAPRSSPFNLTEKILEFMNVAACRAVFGGVCMDKAELIMLMRRSMDALGRVELVDLFPSVDLLNIISSKAYDDVLNVKQRLDMILNDVIDKHRKNVAATGKGYGEQGTEDFVDVLLRLKERDHHLLKFPLTDDIIKGVIFDIVAGAESAASVAVWAMAELVRNPIIMAKLQAEIREAFRGRKTIEESEMRKLSYLKAVVKESMRLHPQNALIPRTCSEDLSIEGYRVPQDSYILINVWWLARDPKNWKEPEKFVPERFEGNSIDFLGNHFEYIPFGAGKRMCPGIAFTMANVELLLAQLLYYYDWKLPVGTRAEDLDMTESGGIILTKKRSLNLIATPYAPAFTQG